MAEEENKGFDGSIMEAVEKENAAPKQQVDQGGENQESNPQDNGQQAKAQTQTEDSGEQGKSDNQEQESEQQPESEQQAEEQKSGSEQSESEQSEGEAQQEQESQDKGLSDLFGGQSNGENDQSQKEEQPQVDPQVQQELQQYGVNDPTDPNQVVQAIRNLQQQQQSEVPQELKDDPVFEDFKNWRSQGGKDIDEFAKRYSVPNPQELDTKTAYQKQLELEGLSPKSIEQAMEEFEGMEEWKQEREAINAKNKLSEWYQKQEEAKKKGPDPQAQNQEEQQQKINEFIRQYEPLVTNTVGNEVYGWQITQDVAEDIRQRPFKEGIVVMKGDQLDPKLTAKLNLIENYGDKIFETVKTKAKNELNKELSQDTHKPSKNDTPTRSNQQSGGEKSMSEKAEDIAKAYGWS